MQNEIKINSDGITLSTYYSTYKDNGINAFESTKIQYDYDDIFQEMMKRFSKKPLIKHQCHSCGATLELEEEKHIFVCKYCGSCYVVGTEMINSL